MNLADEEARNGKPPVPLNMEDSVRKLGYDDMRR